jgi:hypothetical protein
VSSRSPAGRGRAASFAAAVAAGGAAQEEDVAAPVGPAASDSDGADEAEGEDDAFVKVGGQREDEAGAPRKRRPQQRNK